MKKIGVKISILGVLTVIVVLVILYIMGAINDRKGSAEVRKQIREELGFSPGSDTLDNLSAEERRLIENSN